MSGLNFFDRLTGQRIQKPHDVRIAGRYAFLDGDPPFSNGLLLEPGDLLIPSPEDKLSLEPEDGDSILIDGIPFQQFPDRIERQSLITIGTRLKNLEAENAGWRKWIAISPLVVAANLDRLHLTSFERSLKKYSWHLAQVSVRPRTQLTIEIEKLPVGRARRIPSRAYSYLASHTEDWEYPKLTTVVPRKILSTIPEDLLDFYENRLATRLTRETFVYLAQRRAEISELEKWKGELEFGTHRRQSRVFRLLAEAMNKDELLKSAEQMKRVLDSLYEQVLSIFDSPLYRAIPAQSRESVPTSIRATNILVNDRHYRYVNLLWREYLERGQARPKSNIDVQRELQDLCHAFERYTMLMICRALTQLGYSPLIEMPIKPGAKITLAGPWDNIDLLWDNSGVIMLFDGDSVRLRIIPLISALTSSGNEAIVTEQIKSLLSPFLSTPKISKNVTKGNIAEKRLISTLVVYPGGPRERKKLSLSMQRLACSPGLDLHLPVPIGLVPVRTYELGSLERVARSICWAVVGDSLLQYPYPVSIPVKYREQITKNAKWLRITSSINYVVLFREPGMREEQHLKELVGDLRGELVRQGQKANQQEIDRLNIFMSEIHVAEDRLSKLRTCPVCHREARIESFRPLDDDCFSCECSERDCGAVWGVRLCRNCNNHFPFIGFYNPILPDTPSMSDWVDHVYGMDVLAAPCPIESDTLTFVCPFCGDCGRRRSDKNCNHCQVLNSKFLTKIVMEGKE